MMKNKIKFKQGDLDDEFVPSNSEDEYSEDEKRLLKEIRKVRGKSGDSKKELFAFDDSDEEDDDEIALADSDIEGKEDEDDEAGIPDSKAWGQRKRLYYNTDFVDQDYSSFNAQEEEDAKQEEEEARSIQTRLAKDLEEADFFADAFQETAADDSSNKSKTKVKADYSNLNKEQKAELFHKENPEFKALAEDYQKFSEESTEILVPVLEYADEKNIELPLIEFIKTRHNIITLYLMNLYFYFKMKSDQLPIRHHPVTKRLVQMKKLLNELQEPFETQVCPELEKIFAAIDSGEDLDIDYDFFKQKTKRVKEPSKKKKKLAIVKSLEDAEDNDTEDDEEYDQEIGFGGKVDEEEQEKAETSDDEDGGDDEEKEEEVEMEEEDDDGKRGITYQIAKNKGLLPCRKKEVRNPRVKHKNKFRKANIRRKGAVRTVRKELSRYGGELSGIKATVKKGIKIKS